jgi:hypothetical protein
MDQKVLLFINYIMFTIVWKLILQLILQLAYDFRVQYFATLNSDIVQVNVNRNWIDMRRIKWQTNNITSVFEWNLNKKGKRILTYFWLILFQNKNT